MKESSKNLSLISENLATLYENGVPIIMAIGLLEDLPLDKYYKKSIKTIKDRITKGDSLWKAFRIYPSLYPDFFTGLIALGEKSGNLTKVLKSLNNYYSKRKQIKAQIISSMIYPIFLICIMVVVCIFFILVIIPSLTNAYKSIQIELPYIIVKLSSFRDKIINDSIFVISCFVCYGVLMPAIIIKLIKSKIKITQIFLKISICKDYYEYLLILNLSIILNSGLLLTNAIENCANNSGQVVIKNELFRLNCELLHGTELNKAIEQNNILSKQTKAMIKIGEVSGSLDSIVSKLEELIKEKLNAHINKLVKKIQPTITIIMALIISGFIFIVIMPIFNLMYK